jgi:hypothetical protein
VRAQVPHGQRKEPEGNRTGGDHDDDEPAVRVDGLGCGGGDAREGDREHEEQSAEGTPLGRRSHGGTVERPRLQSRAQPHLLGA